MVALEKLGHLWRTYRRRIAPAIAVAAILVVGGSMMSGVPREVHVRYSLGPAHSDIQELRIVYVIEGETVKGVRFDYPEGAPERVNHRIELPPGRYTIEATLIGESGRFELRRALVVPAEGRVDVELFTLAYARRLELVGGAG